MPGDADIASIAALLADPTRAAMLLALSDGRAFTAGELAKSAGVNTWAASSRPRFWPSLSRGAIASTIWLIPPLSKLWKVWPASLLR